MAHTCGTARLRTPDPYGLTAKTAVAIAARALRGEVRVVRDLRVYAQARGANVEQYRDNTGLEVDAVVDAGPGRWAAFEIKLGASRIDDAARTLLKFADRVDTERCGEPAALGVIVGSGYGYLRPDGVAVIPVGAMGP